MAHGRPARRTARPAPGPGRRRRTWSRRTTPRARPRRRRPAGRVRHLRAPRLGARHRVQRGAHPRHHPGDLRVPRRAGVRRAAVHRPRHPRAVRAGLGDRARGARRQRRDRARRRRRRATRRPRRSPTRSSAPTAGKTGSGLADGIVVTPSHNPPRDGGFKYNPPHGGPADTDATDGDRGPRQRAARAPGLDGVRRDRRSPGRGRPRAPYDFLGDLRRRPAERLDIDAIREAGRADRRRPAGRRERRLLGRDRRAARPRPDRGQPAGRPDVAVHDAGLGRQDPDGLLVAVARWPRWSRQQGRVRRSPPATTPTPTGTASSPPTAG